MGESAHLSELAIAVLRVYRKRAPALGESGTSGNPLDTASDALPGACPNPARRCPKLMARLSYLAKRGSSVAMHCACVSDCAMAHSILRIGAFFMSLCPFNTTPPCIGSHSEAESKTLFTTHRESGELKSAR